MIGYRVFSSFHKQMTRFKPHSQKSIKNNFLSGISLPCWYTVLREHWRDIEWFTYWPRILYVSIMAIFNTIISFLEKLVYGNQVSQTRIHESPIFVLGHPRTGTTLIQYLFSRDPTLGFPSTWMCGFPHGFLLLDRLKGLLRGIVDKKRPMDNMAIDFDLPMEDELPISHMASGVSPYFQTLVFMKQEKKFRRYFTLEHTTKEELSRWTDSFLHFLRKVTFSWGKPTKRIVLKSPVHTARIRLLLKMFPKAQFVYVHRNPYEVFQSACNMAQTTYYYTYLNTPTDDEIMDFILNQFETLLKEYLETRSLIPKGNLVEVSFTELEADPIATMKKIYTELQIPSFDSTLPLLKEYVATLKDFQKNKFKPLPEEDAKLVRDRWKEAFTQFGYEM